MTGGLPKFKTYTSLTTYLKLPEAKPLTIFQMVLRILT